jgi:DNA-binding winged helix-turn-helix (wHTH) protein/pimeloyl-ACP methyl ester carboxylesterase
MRGCRSATGQNLSVRYQFAESLLDTTRYELLNNGEPVHVEPQVFDVLAHLVAHRDRVVPKTELLDTVWGHQFVTESALTTRVKQLRQAVGDTGRDQRIVQTVHGRGYRFIAPVEELPGGVERTPLPVPDELRQEIRFCTTPDGTRLAYATVGTGPPLVRAAHWITHLDYDWQSPVWRHWLVGLARRHSLVRYDERGCGLSDHDVEDFSIDAWVQDLETVVDDLGLERFPLLGVSQGGAVAVAYAARHPERVTRLVLYGTYAYGRMRRATTDEMRREASLQVEMVRIGWGREDAAFRRFFTSSFGTSRASSHLGAARSRRDPRSGGTGTTARLDDPWRSLQTSLQPQPSSPRRRAGVDRVPRRGRSVPHLISEILMCCQGSAYPVTLITNSPCAGSSEKTKVSFWRSPPPRKSTT